MVNKEFTTFPSKFGHSKVFFHCVQLGNIHPDTQFVIEPHDVASMADDSRRWVSLWPLTKKNAGLFVFEVRIIVWQAALVE